MKSFKSHSINLKESLELLQLEEKNQELAGKASSDTKGKLHELLVGHHLLGGKHMTKHKDKEGDTPKQVHDKLKVTIHADEYKKIYKRAKESAEDIRSRIEINGHKIHDVHWTSQSGDIKRSTGIESSQKQDASDIVVHSNKGKSIKHHGVSLKVSDSSTKHVPVSNPGIEATHGADHILEKHRKHILSKYPVLGKLSVSDRKEKMKNDPKMNTYIRNKNKETLTNMTRHLHEKLKSMNHKDLVNHIKTHVLQSNPTPMQQAGHEHIRHTTYFSGGKNKHHAINPSEHHEHIFKDAKNITIHHDNKGSSIIFKHKDKSFASHRMKFNSQSDPLSAVKGSGVSAGD